MMKWQIVTSEYVILIILISFGSNFYQTFQAVVCHKEMNKIFVILQVKYQLIIDLIYRFTKFLLKKMSFPTLNLPW